MKLAQERKSRSKGKISPPLKTLKVKKPSKNSSIAKDRNSKKSIAEELRAAQASLDQRNNELAIINSIQSGLASHLDVQSIYVLVGEEIRDIFNAQVVMISTYDAATDTIEHRYAIEQGERVFAPGQFPCKGFRSRIVETKRPVLVNENVAEQAALLGQPTLPGTITPKSWLGVPMLVGSQVTGILSLQNVDRENAFSPSDVQLLETLANSMSVALENARLWEQEKAYRKTLQRELEIGREIQAGFLPRELPTVPGWEIAAYFKAAHEVAGDFYDAFVLPDGNIACVIGDVCGKGVGAALFMTLFRSLIRATSTADLVVNGKLQEGFTPVTRLQHVVNFTNHYVAETHGEATMFATAFIGIIDIRDGTLSYINAGNESPLMIQMEGAITPLSTTGPAIGVIPGAAFSVKQMAMGKNDILLAYTDGITDALNPGGESFGNTRIAKLIDHGSSPSKLLERIEKDLKEHIGDANPFDDITILAIKKLA